jgi:hypothetical protein
LNELLRSLELRAYLHNSRNTLATH